MADTLTTYTGRGPEGEFSIDLPNWAREVTQVKIDKKLGDLNKNFKNLPKNMQSAFESALKKNVGALNKIADQNKKEATASAKRDRQETQHRNKTQQAEAALLNATLQNAQAIQDLEKITNDNNVGGGSLANLVSKAGPFGKIFQVLTKSFGMLAGAIKGVATAMLALGTFIVNNLMQTFNMLNRSLSDGTGMLMGAFTDSTVNVAAEASKAGMSLSEFTDALAENSEEIRVLGTEGFRELRNAVRDNIGGMYDLGYSQEEITTLLGREISIRQRLGMRLDIAGDQLEDDVVLTSRELRSVANAAGVNAEVLYQAAKLTDETNTLVSARARQFGDEGISELFTSIRQLSLRISGLAPTFGSQITSPLVNAIVTGAIGLDDEFAQLITVMPQLRDAFEMGRADIMNGGKLTADTIENMVDSLATATERDFERAKMLALMTRNQTAIQAVNFANEVRAREKLIGDINDQGLADRIRDSATITQQASQFFDIMKAPLENGMTNFILSVLGTGETGKDLTLATVVEDIIQTLATFGRNLPVIGSVFDGDFFAQLNQAVDAYFDPNATATDRNRARNEINALVTKTISDIGDSFNKVLTGGTLVETLSDFFRQLFDELIIAIYEGTGFMGESAFTAYMRKGDVGRASQVEIGAIASLFGMENDAGDAIAHMILGGKDDIAARFGVRGDELFEYYRTRGRKKGKSLERLSELELNTALDELGQFLREYEDGISGVRARYGTVDNNTLMKAFKEGDEALLQLVFDLADPRSRINQLTDLDYKDAFIRRDDKGSSTNFGFNAAGQALLESKGITYLNDPDFLQSLVNSFYIDLEQGISDPARRNTVLKKIAARIQYGGSALDFSQIIADAVITEEEMEALGIRKTERLDKEGKGTGMFDYEAGTLDPNSPLGLVVAALEMSTEESLRLQSKMAALIQQIDPNQRAQVD